MDTFGQDYVSQWNDEIPGAIIQEVTEKFAKEAAKSAHVSAAERAYRSLLEKIVSRSARVGIVGMGYVGVPLAVEKAKAGFQVLGIDLDRNKTARINRGENYIPDVDDDELKELTSEKRFQATSDFSAVSELDVIVIAVPTPLTPNLTPDLTCVISATKEIARSIRRGQLICLESTTYPGTTEEVMLPILSESGLKAGYDYFLVHSPERVDPGNHKFKTKNTTKVVGGVGIRSLELGTKFYEQTIEQVVPVSSAKAAELVKIFENTFRSVNIALVNEMAMLCDKMDLNVWEVLDAAFTKPFGILPFYPGPGVGGHCIPLDPHYLEWKAKEFGFDTRIITLAGDINRRMPDFVCRKAFDALNHRGIAASVARVLVLGVAYKRDIGDYRESPSLRIIEGLNKVKAQVIYHDPFVPSFREHGLEMECHPLNETVLREQDLVIIATDHTTIDYSWVLEHSTQVLDTRNATKKIRGHRDRIVLL